MGFTDVASYVMFENPVSKYVVFDNPVSKYVTSFAVPSKTPQPQQVTVIAERVPLWKLANEGGPFLRIAGVMGASAVVLAAYGAHKSFPKDGDSELKPIFETANRIHFFHTLALLGVPLTRRPILTGTLLLAGTICFSGTCYYHAFSGKNKFGKFAPVGGILLITGWLTMAL